MLEVGYIAKAQGIRGEVLVVLTTDRAERVAPGSQLHTDKGTLTVVRSRPHQDRYVVLFEGISDRTQAESLRGRVLNADPLDDPDALWVHELIGSKVVEKDGTERGVVLSVIANPASDILELDTGALVPLRFVKSHDNGVVTVDTPEGLFDLDDE